MIEHQTDLALSHYASHSAFSDPGPSAPMLDALPDDLAAMRNATSRLMLHYIHGRR